MSMDHKRETHLRQHDYFNLVSLFIISLLDLRYLYNATDWNLFGTDELGEIYFDKYYLPLQYMFVIYMIIDTIWIKQAMLS
jgi:hypothetical protein